jgi:biotin synthase
MKLNISSGTASVLGLSPNKPKTDPTTAYIMVGQNCRNSCLFCPQGLMNASKKEFLSRVDWNFYDEKEVLEKLSLAYLNRKVKRVCLQVVDTKESYTQTLDALQTIKKVSPIPICTSSPIKTISDAKVLFEKGLDRLCISLDTASNNVYNRVKGYGFLEKINFLLDLSKNFPNKITTHLIVGLGESEMDLAELIHLLNQHHIQVALFAFTPIQGTPMENNSQPSINCYRRIQIIHYLLQENKIHINNILHEKRTIKDFIPSQNNSQITSEGLKNFILESKGKAFMTSGCPDCNRPYYNETPLQVPYNYPYWPSEDEVRKAILSSKLFNDHDMEVELGLTST